MTPAETRAIHFARLNGYRNSREYADWCESVGWDRPAGELPSLVGTRWRIDEAIYEEFLNMMPPLHWTGASFYCCEAAFGGFHAKFSWEGDRYYCEFARLPRRANAPEPRP